MTTTSQPDFEEWGVGETIWRILKGMIMRWRAINLSLDGSFDNFNFSDDYDDDAKHFSRMSIQ